MPLTETIQPIGELQQPYLLGWLIASSSTFRDQCGVLEAAEAFDRHVHYPSAMPSAGVAPPWAIVNDEVSFSTRLAGDATWVPDGSLALSIDLWVPEKYSHSLREQNNWYRYAVGKILTDMRTTSTARGEGPIAGQSHLDVRSFTLASGYPFRVHIEESGLLDAAVDYAHRPLWTSLWIVEHG